MNRTTGFFLILVIFVCAVSSGAGQDNSKVADLPKTTPEYVYRSFNTPSATVATTYSKEGWELVSPSGDGTSGIFRRKYVNLDATKEPLKSLQGKWTIAYLNEYGTNKYDVEVGKKTDPPPTLTFTDNTFTFTQIDLAAMKKYTQKGTLQYFLPLNAAAGVYAIDLLIDEDKTTLPILFMELTWAQTHPYSTIRCVWQAKKDSLVIASGGSEDARPSKEFEPWKTPAYSQYQK